MKTTNLPTHKLSKLSLLVVSAMLSACSMGPEYQVPDLEIDSSYSKQQANQIDNQQTVTAGWWHQFNDPILNSLVEQAQQQNLNIKMAANRIQAAQAYRSAVASFKVPTVSLGGGYTSYQLSKNGPLTGPAFGIDNPISGGQLDLLERQNGGFFAGANVSWEMDLFGRINKQVSAAEIRGEQAKIYHQGMHTLVSAEIVNNYLQYRGAQQRIAIAKRNISEQETVLKLVKSLTSSGYGSELDVAKAQSALALSRAALPQLNSAENVHLNRIALVLGQSPSQLTAQLAEPQKLPTFNGLIPVGLPSDLLTQRPDISIAEREMAAVNQELAATVVSNYPRFFLTGGPGLSAKNFDDLFKADSGAWLASVGVQWTLFDGGRHEAMVEMQQQRFNNSALHYQQSVNSAFIEVETMLMAYGNSQEFASNIEQASAQADLALSKADSLYRAGLIDHLAVLDAQRQQNLLEDAQILAKLQTANTIVGLHKSLGGDWSLN
ncbi:MULTISPECIES: efflux transporter outer membrane subunit [unclassified Agarivorans]|uniref:efflux transporter outer membrane subunit n=1 Tax=unclassified Agarivorans TaxID=2636026 RepID=UPI0026E1C16D|nr:MULTISPECIES: efflux transporter outer membrane subunit [unclassified Agarivorans]MDO6684102.1 efflux transporter outer membrane subunit [Agarivorans sp. 3_MG-2023]MDO6714164.1 efflux transporter outer membrane subunit [Agarivorans sp. 2_MG-2023]